jgi:hypothetical protein
MKKTISIPTINEITTWQYINLIKSSGNTDQFYNILFGVDLDDLNYIDDIQRELIDNELYKLIDDISKFDSKEVVESFTFNNKKYKISKMSHITNEEYLALTELAKNINENLIEITAILYKTYEKKSIFKYWKKVEDDDIEFKILIFSQLPFKIALSAVFFCLNYKLKLIRKEMKKLKMK